MAKRWIPLFFILIFQFSILNAQEIITAEGYLRLVSENYSSIRDFEGNVTIRSGNTEMIGTVSYLTPSFLRIECTRPAGQVIVFNSEALTIYIPEMRAVLQQSINQSRRAGTSSGLSLLQRGFVASFLTGPNPEALDASSSERVVKLRLTRRSASEGFREIILSINAESKLIRRLEGRTIAEGEVRMDFTNIRTNQGIPEQRFIYDSPPNANMYQNFLFRDTE
ncbi:MAG: outer-membrane lipoprotein carrier protein LolA [Treponema sp.]|nr:outer-membrane lipoprotein carrier protein LolA [Treponema sp.]